MYSRITSCFIGLDISIVFWSQFCLWNLERRVAVQVLTHLAQIKPRCQRSCVIVSLFGFLNERVWQELKITIHVDQHCSGQSTVWKKIAPRAELFVFYSVVPANIIAGNWKLSWGFPRLRVILPTDSQCNLSLDPFSFLLGYFMLWFHPQLLVPVIYEIYVNSLWSRIGRTLSNSSLLDGGISHQSGSNVTKLQSALKACLFLALSRGGRLNFYMYVPYTSTTLSLPL